MMCGGAQSAGAQETNQFGADTAHRNRCQEWSSNDPWHVEVPSSNEADEEKCDRESCSFVGTELWQKVPQRLITHDAQKQ
mmetsp:Transcript_119574/g.386046  ORF Transcript_119574/g.386046 Transcript_119574/m.386046 type:complete len:80 (+) Transcript_119574:1162-1401(+)